MEIILKDLGATEAFAHNVLNLALALKKEGGATLVSLHGDLGSGKTTLVQFIASKLGIKEDIQSPTFVIEKFYDISGSDFKKLVHIDAYRIERPEEFEALKIKDTLSDSSALVIVEWPKQGGVHFNNPALEVFLEFVDDSTRKARITKNA